MKKAKLFLAAIAVMAVVGGVYAAKAKRSTDTIFVKTTTTTNVCTVPLTFRTLSPTGPFVTTTYATLVQGATCTLTPIYSGE
ncbi:hypothetical protein [Pedobacter sp. HMWF019]|uniref:hypothetical protein n=1 Tax=Pedobacter sp. HMWF019 TaxID=2056856 RepID=UPI001304B07E|nr:hypothetical protein [Pedobacter sp. HMWF019]